MRIIASIIVILLSACATPITAAPPQPKQGDLSNAFVGPNGGTAYLLQCFDLEACYQRARQICAGNYVIFDSIDTPVGDGYRHYISFECKK